MDNTTTTNTPSAVGLSKATLEELLRLGQTIGDPKQATVNGIPYAVIPQNCKVEDLTRFLHNQFAANPHRKTGTVSVFDAPSFIEYFQLFADANSRVFADETTSTVLGVIDYHRAGEEGSARWGDHRVKLDLRYSEEWKRWTGKSGKQLTQMEFAEFVEDNTPDIVEPRAADVLEVARTLQAKTDVDFASSVRTANGQVQFTYSEQVKGTYGNGKLDIPEQFVISIPVYVGHDRIRIIARLRYRLNSGKLTFWYDLLRADVVKRDAFLAVADAIGEGIPSKIINGVPAAKG